MSKQRLDQIIANFHPQWSRSKIQTLIEKGCVQIFTDRWKVESRPGSKFESGALDLKSIKIEPLEELKYVSRGALKLKQAVERFKIQVEAKVCLDVGLSTGGFSDFLLQSAAKSVLGIDVGTDQVHPSLRQKSQLTFYDHVNARNPLPTEILESFFSGCQPVFDIIVVDVSFISLSLIIPNLKPLMNTESQLITLLKPQFELSRSDLNKKGVVKSPELIEVAKNKIIEALEDNELQIGGICESPIEGENGNKEFLILSSVNERSHSVPGL